MFYNGEGQGAPEAYGKYLNYMVICRYCQGSE
jgi:hypothetical protein